MTDRARLAQIRVLSQLVLDGRLNALERAARARQTSLDHLAELARPVADSGLPLAVAGEMAGRYQRWADQRRAEINLILARQTVEWAEARAAASQAFGRNQAIQALISRNDQLS